MVTSLLERFPASVRAEAAPNPSPERPPAVLIAAIKHFDGKRFILDERHADKQPDWTFDAEDSGQAPADRIDQLAHES